MLQQTPQSLEGVPIQIKLLDNFEHRVFQAWAVVATIGVLEAGNKFGLVGEAVGEVRLENVREP